MPSQETIEAINAASVVVLVIVTTFYVIFTYKILKAVERQAESSEETVRLLRQEAEDLAGLGRRQIETAIKVTLKTIEHWKTVNLQDVVYSGKLPGDINLLPDYYESALDYANRMSSSLASPLSEGFQEVRFAEGQLEIMKGSSNRTGLYAKHSPKFLSHLSDAQKHLENAQLELNARAG